MTIEIVPILNDKDFLAGFNEDLANSEDTPIEEVSIEDPVIVKEPIIEIKKEKEVTSADATLLDKGSLEVDSEAIKPDLEDIAIDSSVELAKILAPFKANGAMTQAHTVDEAITLMQKGAGFHKAMHDIKPAKRIQATLSKHQIDENGLNYLIDLYLGKPEAIAELLRKNKIDPLEINVKDDANYIAESHQVSENSVDFEDMLTSLKTSESGNKVLDIMANTWDSNSRQFLASSPEAINVLQDHIASGVYAKVSERVAHERMLGTLRENMSDWDAYQSVGKQMARENAFSGAPSSNTPVIPKASDTSTAPSPSRSKVASPRNKPVTATKAPARFKAPLSDDDFMKMFN